MNSITKSLLRFCTLILIMCAVGVPVMAQERGIVKEADSDTPKSFGQLLADIGLSFNFPDSFKEVKVPATEALPFNYGMALPGAEFEVWFRALTQKDSEKLLADKNIHVPSTDSVFVSLAQDQLLSFSSEKNYLRRNLPAYILRRYNADAGATYLLSINDTRLTKHYKYALLTAIQKNQAGVVLAVCFTNDKGPDFFRTMNMAAGCLRFKD